MALRRPVARVVDGEHDPVVLGLGEDDDGLQHDEAEEMTRSASSIVAWRGDDAWPELTQTTATRLGCGRGGHHSCSPGSGRGQRGAAQDGGGDGGVFVLERILEQWWSSAGAASANGASGRGRIRRYTAAKIRNRGS